MKDKLTRSNIGFVFVIFSIILFSIGIVCTLVIPSNNSNNDLDKVDPDDESGSTINIENGNSNTNEGVIEDKKLGDFKFTNTSLVTNETGSTLTTLVQNTTNKDIKVKVFSIFVKDKDGKTITVLTGYVGDVIPANSSKVITSYTVMNLENAVSIEYQMMGQ